MQTEILGWEDIVKARKIIEENGVIAFPTETVYGLGIRANSFLAYNNLFEAKNRPNDKVLTLMLSKKEDIAKYAFVSKNVQRIIDKFMPGDLTIVLFKKTDVDLYGLEDTVGIRIPNSEETLSFLSNIEYPLYVTSANISGFAPCKSFAEVSNTMNNRIAAIIDGVCAGGNPSTVVSLLNDEIKILREGNITYEDIKGVFISE